MKWPQRLVAVLFGMFVLFMPVTVLAQDSAEATSVPEVVSMPGVEMAPEEIQPLIDENPDAGLITVYENGEGEQIPAPNPFGILMKAAGVLYIAVCAKLLYDLHKKQKGNPR